jgi:hypothetical protein
MLPEMRRGYFAITGRSGSCLNTPGFHFRPLVNSRNYSVADPDTGGGAFLTPGSGMEKNADQRSGI